MSICEMCSIEHDSSYGSGRFCSKQCARRFSTHAKRGEINDKVRTKLQGTTHSRGNGGGGRKPTKLKKPKMTRSEWSEFNRQKFAKTKLEQKSVLPFDEWPMSWRREAVLQEQNGKCIWCGVGNTYNGKPLFLELDHIDGNNQNNSRDNLRFLCPNCHQQTPTYKTKRPKKKITDEEILQTLQQEKSIYAALKSLGMNTHGSHYPRFRKLWESGGRGESRTP